MPFMKRTFRHAVDDIDHHAVEQPKSPGLARSGTWDSGQQLVEQTRAKPVAGRLPPPRLPYGDDHVESLAPSGDKVGHSTGGC